ncbi:MAG TPA: S8 family serine peptidase [Candidatus Udaeobacter sp.]|nr:S8 family serine peptidase [Candidatus Udaeobacter sp.]
MKRFPPRFLLAASACAASAMLAYISFATTGVSTNKITPSVLAEASSANNASVIILLREQADVSAAYAIKDQDARGWYVYNTLRQHAERTQQSLRAFLDARHISYQPFWAANMIAASVDRADLESLAAREDVARIDSNVATRSIEEAELNHAMPTQSRINAPASVEWNVTNVNAPQLWAQGFTGVGIVVGVIDTGVRWTHSALRSQYRGWNGSSADHNFNWHDAIHSSGGPCGANSAQPCDDFASGHGTPVLGSAVGDDGVANQIGVAPGAKWIACRNMDQGVTTPAAATECFQFMIAPTDLNGNNPNPSLRPHVLNNAWACTASNGCTTGSELETIVNNTQAAGIFVVAAAGGGGPACETVSDAPAFYNAAFSAGAYDINNVLAGFSSRGPSTFDLGLKPNLTAPGVNIRSSSNTSDTSFAVTSGTSPASAHVSGVVALLWSARPDLVRNIASTKDLLQRSANPAVTVNPPQTCAGISSTRIPNYSFGYGRVDALAARFGDLVVTTLSDSNNGSCGATCSLRDAINIADTQNYTLIHFATGLQGTIQLSSALPPLNRNVIIEGPGANLLTVQRVSGGDYRIFTIGSGRVVNISGLTISNGKGTTNGGGILNDHSILFLSRCVLIGNTGSNGGGLLNDGSGVQGNAIAELDRCTFRNNSVTAFGGAIFNSGASGGSASLELTNCTIADNSAATRGGAIYNVGDAPGSTLFPILNCTVSNNSAALGGIFNSGTSGMSVRNSIFKTGATGANFFNSGGTITSVGYNISNDSAGGDGTTGPGGILNGTNDRRNTNPQLDPAGLSNNGGSTSTIALLSNSPAINAVDINSAPRLDQRGFLRAGASDIGAFEFNGTPAEVTLTAAVSTKTHGGAGAFEINLLAGSPAIECRGGGTGNNHIVVFRFANPLTSVAGANLTGTGAVSSAVISGDPHEYVVYLTNVTNGQVMTVRLTNVNDVLGNHSDTIAATMGVLLGDTTGNGSVNASDVSQTKSKSGTSGYFEFSQRCHGQRFD